MNDKHKLPKDRPTIMPFGYLRDALKLINFQSNILNQDFNLQPSNLGLDSLNLLSTNKKYKGDNGEH